MYAAGIAHAYRKLVSCIAAHESLSGRPRDVHSRGVSQGKKVIAINHKEFDATVESGMSALALAARILPIASLLIGFLALLGIRPRLREYAA